jgi:L-lactate dehydrogenase (cytochrome)/(S)-mandelate dehydrogenase
MDLGGVVNVEDMRKLARRKLPKIIYDFIEGGCDDDYGIDENVSAFSACKLWPRYYGELGEFSQSTRLFWQDYALPFGIGVTGLAGLFRPGADLILARAARNAKIPFIVSTFSNDSVEKCAAEAGPYCWFQLYGARDRNVSADMIRRARDSGVKVLAMTVDTPVSSKRERNMRNGFTRPISLRPSILLDAMMHPAWTYRYLRAGGVPVFGNWQPYAPPNSSANDVTDYTVTQTPNRQTWKDFETARRLWPHALVAKGVMHPDDARKAVDAGADGVFVSNHGGRVLDRTPGSLDVLPSIRDAVGDKTTLILDSGIRRGSDIVTSYCLGAQFTFVGRATLYGACAAAGLGVAKVIDILSKETETIMGQIGAATLAELGPQFLFSGAKAANLPGVDR